VTGYSEGTDTSDDYATIKYDAVGTEQWVARYNGPGNSDDRARAIAVDGSGNVYVTGYSEASNRWYDYATIKYDSAGAEQWIASYNGPVGSGDMARAIAVDGSGNIYVTGYSNGSSTEFDYATIKYNAGGFEQWVARYNGQGNSYNLAEAIAVDGSGNVYVTGSSEGSGTGFDYATIKYIATGAEQWIARYNGQENSTDWVEAITVNGSGNVYVTGSSEGTNTSDDYVTIKYDEAGAEQWITRYNGQANSTDWAEAIAVDGFGNVFVTGYSEGINTSDDYVTIKYDEAGAEQWIARYNGPGNSDDKAVAIAVDGLENVYVTGYSEGTGTSDDYATIKYDAAGVELWVARYNGPWNSTDRVVAIAVDGSGDVYVTGRISGSGIGSDYVTIKYDTAGVEQWVARYYNGYTGPGNYLNRAYACDIAVDGSGNVYVTGSSEGSDTGFDYTTIKYNSAGVEEWIARYNGLGNSDDWAEAIAIDGSGNVYVTGSSEGSDTGFDYATIKHNTAGEEQWIARYNGPGNSDDWAKDIAIDGSGNVYVIGYSETFDWSIYTTIKYLQTQVSVEVQQISQPKSFQLAQNYPNPFNLYTTIRFQLPVKSEVTITIFNVLGHKVRTLLDRCFEKGHHYAVWDGRDDFLNNVANGVYLYQFKAGSFVAMKKILLLK